MLYTQDYCVFPNLDADSVGMSGAQVIDLILAISWVFLRFPQISSDLLVSWFLGCKGLIYILLDLGILDIPNILNHRGSSLWTFG